MAGGSSEVSANGKPRQLFVKIMSFGILSSTDNGLSLNVSLANLMEWLHAFRFKDILSLGT